MPRWSAAQMLLRIALGKPLKLTEWPSDMSGQILPAQLKLHEAIVQRRIIDVRGRRGPPGSKERVEELLSDSEFTLLVTPHGTLTVHPPHKRLKFIEKYGMDPDNWVREIDFDQDEGEQAFSAPLAPCQRPPDRLHLRLVSGARSGETEAPAARAEESMPKPAPAVEPEPPRVESVPPPESAPATNAEDQGEAAATAAETAGTQLKKRRSTLPKKRHGTRGPLPETTERVVAAIEDDIRTEYLTIKEGRLFKGSHRALQKDLQARYKCSTGTLRDAWDIALLKLETPTNSDKKTPTNSDETPTNSDKK
jgi:hypothetical protein